MTRHCHECGAVQRDDKALSRRSAPQHRRQFKIFAALHEHWPKSHLFQPRNSEHLRYWLEVQAGHCDVIYTKQIKSVPADKLAALLTAVLSFSKDKSLFVEVDADQLVVMQARSISYSELPHREACRLFDAIGDVISAETGIDPEQLLKEADAA